MLTSLGHNPEPNIIWFRILLILGPEAHQSSGGQGSAAEGRNGQRKRNRKTNRGEPEQSGRATAEPPRRDRTPKEGKAARGRRTEKDPKDQRKARPRKNRRDPQVAKGATRAPGAANEGEGGNEARRGSPPALLPIDEERIISMRWHKQARLNSELCPLSYLEMLLQRPLQAHASGQISAQY